MGLLLSLDPSSPPACGEKAATRFGPDFPPASGEKAAIRWARQCVLLLLITWLVACCWFFTAYALLRRVWVDDCCYGRREGLRPCPRCHGTCCPAPKAPHLTVFRNLCAKRVHGETAKGMHVSLSVFAFLEFTACSSLPSAPTRA